MCCKGLLSSSPFTPILLSHSAASVKACFGHTEGTAGAHGAMAAGLALAQHAAPPVMHSRSLNPYIASAFEGWSSTRQNALPLVAREATAWPAAVPLLAGCSSFGMSGVNAHALLSAPHTQQQHRTAALAWDHQRCWPMPAHHHMLMAAKWDRAGLVARWAMCAAARPTLSLFLAIAACHSSPPSALCPPISRRLQCSLAAAGLAFLLDHVVQGSSILPGAGMLEMCTARWVQEAARWWQAAGPCNVACLCMAAQLTTPTLLPPMLQRTHPGWRGSARAAAVPHSLLHPRTCAHGCGRIFTAGVHSPCLQRGGAAAQHQGSQCRSCPALPGHHRQYSSAGA